MIGTILEKISCKSSGGHTLGVRGSAVSEMDSRRCLSIEYGNSVPQLLQRVYRGISISSTGFELNVSDSPKSNSGESRS